MPRKSRRRVNGEGTIRKRIRRRKDGSTYKRWFASLTIGIDPETGRQKRLEGPWRETEAEANRDRAVLAEQLGKTNVDAYYTTVGEYLDYWLEHHEQTLKPRSIREYRKDITLHLKPELGNIILARLTPQAIQEAQTTLLAKSPYVARKARACLSAALTQAVRWQLLASNPIQAVAPVKLPARNFQWWEPFEVEKFLKTARQHEHYPAYLVMLNLGLRLGELRALQWHDLTSDSLHVQRSLAGDFDLSNPKFGPPKNPRSNRWLPVPADVRRALEAHRVNQDKTRGGHRWREHDLIFTTGIGTPLAANKLREPMVELAKKAGVKRIRIHDLRHTAISLWIASGMDVATVAARAGHADTSMTLRVYTHFFDSRAKREAPTMAELLRGRTPVAP